MKKIAIDARMIRAHSMHGIARYVYELLLCLKDLKTNFCFYVLVNQNSPLNTADWPEHMNIVTMRAAWISFREQWELPTLLSKLQIDLFHAPSFVAPLMGSCRLLMTIHDLNHLVLPQFYTIFHQFYYYTFVRSCMKKSQAILTVSEFSKQEIVRHLSIPDEKIHVTYNGVSKHYAPAVNSDHIAYIRSIYELPEHFILCLSNNKPHKNVLQLVRAYCFSNITIPLVLVCDVDQHLILIADTYGKKHLIYFAKFIEEEHLPALYTMTKLFVYPSTYEGFGLPPLEALACGARVVVARAASLPEVVGDHAIFMDPYDFKDIARSLEEGLREESQESDLKRKKQNIDYATKFSWEVMAEKTHALYERCLKGSTHR